MTIGDEQHRVASGAGAADIGNPIADAAAKLHGGLARHLVHPRGTGVLDCQFLESWRVAQPRLDILPSDERIRRNLAVDGSPLARVPIALVQLRPRFSSLLLDESILRDDQTHPVRGAQSIDRPAQVIVVIESFANGDDQELIGGSRRSLRGRVEAPERFDHVADELNPHRFGIAGREHVEDAAANREGAMLVYWILTSEARVDEQVGETQRLDLRSGTDGHRRAREAFWPTHPRQQRWRRRDHESARASNRRMNRPRPRGRHAKVRAHAAVGIDLYRRKGYHGALDLGVRGAFERSIEEPRVCHQLLDVLVRWHDQDPSAPARRGPRIRRPAPWPPASAQPSRG